MAQFKRVTKERFALLEPPQPGAREFGHLVEALTGAPQRLGNRGSVMRNGVTFDAMLGEISRAMLTIDFSSYIYWPGLTAQGVAMLLGG